MGELLSQAEDEQVRRGKRENCEKTVIYAVQLPYDLLE